MAKAPKSSGAPRANRKVADQPSRLLSVAGRLLANQVVQCGWRDFLSGSTNRGCRIWRSPSRSCARRRVAPAGTEEARHPSVATVGGAQRLVRERRSELGVFRIDRAQSCDGAARTGHPPLGDGDRDPKLADARAPVRRDAVHAAALAGSRRAGRRCDPSLPAGGDAVAVLGDGAACCQLVPCVVGGHGGRLPTGAAWRAFQEF